MANPRLRILLVDSIPSTRMNIEKYLSRLGYHRVAPLCSLRELLVIIENTLPVFDLLIINEQILINAGAVLEHSVRTSSAIRHILVYPGGVAQLSTAVSSPNSALSFSLSSTPDQISLKELMGFVDVSQEISSQGQEISESHSGSIPWVIV